MKNFSPTFSNTVNVSSPFTKVNSVISAALKNTRTPKLVMSALLLVLLSSISTLSYASRSTTISGGGNAGTQMCQGTSVILLNFQNVDGGSSANNTFTNFRFVTNGTAVAADITTYQVYYNTANVFGTATSLGTVAGGAAGTFNIPAGFTFTLATGTYYFWIVANVSATATAGRTVGINGITNAATTPFTFTNANTYNGTVTASGTYTVAAAPTGVTASATPNPVCVNDNLTLTGVATGATTYAWAGPGGTAITAPGSLSTGVTGVVAGNAGVYTLTATTGTCSAKAVTSAVVVNSYPTGVSASLSPNPVCQGQTLTLTGTATGAATYAWTGPTTADIASTTSLSTSVNAAAPADAGVYTLTASNPGCAVTVTTSAVTVNPAPTGVTAAATPALLCVGSALTLTGTSTGGGATYAWTGPTTVDITSASSLSTGIAVVNAGDAGVYTLSATIGACTTSAVTTSVTVNAYPTGVSASVTPNPACSGYPLTLTGTATGATSYAWSGPTTADIVSTTSLSTSIAAVAAGDAGVYTLTASTPGCAVTVTSSAVVVNTTPGIPTGLVNGTITTSSFATSWTAAGGATSYTVTVYIDGGLVTQAIGYTVAYGAGTTATVNGLSSGTPYWYTVTANTATCSSVASTSQTLTTIPTACSGTPVAGISAVTPIAGGAATPFTLSLTGYSTSTGLTYQWQSGPSATGPWTNITGATTTTYGFTGIASDTWYQCIVTCTGSASSSTSTVCEAELAGCTPTTASWLNAPIAQTPFAYIGGTVNWTVPAWVTNIYVDVQGAVGGGTEFGGGNAFQSAGGNGGRVLVTGTAGSINGLTVTSGHVLQVLVGQVGSSGGAAVFGGGGADNTYSSFWPGAGGGGYSGVKDNTSATQLVIAGGGGGGGGDFAGFDNGGAGGGSSSTGIAGFGASDCAGGTIGTGGGGGSASAGIGQGSCLGDAAGQNGAALQGGNRTTGNGAGGGGGGWFGGGTGSDGGGGGGGSSYASAAAVGTATFVPGYNTSANGGLVIITYPLFFQDSIFGIKAFSVTGSIGSINDVNMCAAATPGTGYINRLSSIAPITMYTGGSYATSITWGRDSIYQEAQVWVDFNDNGTFETSEQVSTVVGYSTVLTPQPTTFNITIPSGVNTGTHLMRVRGIMEYTYNGGSGAALSASLDPCLSQFGGVGPKYTAGDVADYVVNITKTPTLAVTPTSLNFGTIPLSTTSAAQTFSITATSLYPVVGNVIVTAPTNYLVSLTGTGGSWQSYVSVPYTGGALSALPIYVEFVGPASSGVYSGNVIINGGSIASAVDVAVTGICAPPCSGTPVAGTATVSPTSGGSTTTFNLGLSGYSIGFGLTYQWQSSATGTSGWTNIPGATNPTYSFTGLLANTYYQCVLVCGFSTLTSTSTVVEATYVGCTTTAASWVNATVTNTYNYISAAAQTWTAPLNVTSVAIQAQGATGGSGNYGGFQSPGGAGGLVYGTLAVTPGQTINIYVASAGQNSNGAGAVLASGGATTGGARGAFGGGGGGASDIRVGGTALTNRVLVAAGGGGGGAFCASATNYGGYGGGVNGGAGYSCGGFSPFLAGQGATQAGGGANATEDGVGFGALGIGANAGYRYGGGGGGGYYGGGSGGDGGGGGGSSYVGAGITSATIDSNYNNAGNGIVILTYTPANEIAQYGVNTFSVTAATGANLSDANMTASATLGTGYLNRLSLSPITLYPGGTYASGVSWGIATAYQEAQVWIDFNNDGVYQTTEQVSAVVGYNASATVNPTLFNVNIPMSVDTGAHLMRVRGIVEYAGGTLALSPSLDPCLNQFGGTGPTYNDGDEADYTVNIKCHVPAIAGTPKVCAGLTTTLSDATTGGTWSMTSAFASVGSTGIVTGTSAGTAVLTYSLSNYCITTQIVTVNANPPAISGTLVVGISSTGNSLSDATSGGAWSTTGDGTITGTSGTATFTAGGVAGTATVTYTAGGCSVTTVVTVSAVAVSPISGANTACANATFTVSDASAGGTWTVSGDASIVGAGTTATVTAGATAGTAIISYTISGVSATSVITINVAPTGVTASGTPNPLCNGGTLTLNGAATGATGYSWTGPGGTSITSATSVNASVAGVVAGNAGVYTLSASNTCGSTTASTLSVSVTATAPTGVTASASPTLLCVGGTITLNGAATGATTYLWTGPGGTAITTPAAINAAVNGAAIGNAGIYTITATNVCGSATGVTTAVTVTATSPTGVTASATPNPLCVGGTLTLNGAATGATTYAWSGPGGTAITSPTTASASVNGVIAGNAGIYTLSATNVCGTSTAATLAVSVTATAPTAVTASATPNPLCNGGTLTLNGAATGATTYSWAGPGGTAITSPTTINASVNGVAAGNAGIYTISATNVCGTTTGVTSVVTVTATAPTGVTASATPNPLCVGGTITLNGTATGASTYSWAGPGGTAITTPTAINASVNGIVAGNAGIYTLSATNVCGTTSGVSATVTVTATAPTGVTASATPNPICAGGTLTLNGTATGAVTYAWAGPGGTAVDVPGSLNTTVSGVVAGNGGVYTLSATNVCGTTSNVSSTVTVTATSPTGVSATATPAIICSGGTLTLNGAATGATSYAWSGPGGTAITSPTSINAAVNGVVAGNAGIYTLSATNVCGTTTGVSSAVSLSGSFPTGVTAVASPTPICIGGTLTLNGTATGASTYSWAGPGGTAISSAGSLSASVNGVVVGNAGVYTLTASNVCGSATATTTVVAVIATAPTAVSASATPNPICNAGTLTLNGAATGATTYAWSGPGGTAITSPATINASVNGVAAGNSGIYTITATNVCGSTTGVTSTVTVTATAPTGVTASAAPNPLCVGGTITLNGAATGATTYAWSGPGGTAITSPTTVNAAVNGVIAGNAGIYSLSATNVCGTTTGSTLVVTVTATVPTAVTASATPNPICNAGTLTLNGGATGATSYSWSGPGGTAITSPTTINASVNGVIAGNAGIYTISATNVCGTATGVTSTVTVTATAPTGVTASATPNPLCVGGTITLNGAATGATGYSWSGPGGTAITSPTTVNASVNGIVAGNAGIYTLSATNVCGSTPGVTSVVTVTATAPTGVTASAAPNPLCVGGTITLSGAATGAATYAWSGPGGTAITSPTAVNASVNGVIAGNAGIYTLSATNVCGTTNGASLTVTVTSTSPTGVSATATPATLCNGGTLTLNGAATGASTYSWAGPGGTAISTPNAINASVNGVVTGNSGVYTISATNVCGTTTAVTSSVNVTTALPTGVSASALPNPLCNGGTLALNGIATGASSYSWAGPGGTAISAPTSTSAFVNGVIAGNAGVYTFSATNLCGTTTAVTSAVTVTPTAPTAVSASATPNPICNAATLTLNGAATGAVSYSWAGPGGTSITSPTTVNASVIGVGAGNAGIYTLSATNVCGTTTAATSAVTVTATAPTGVTASATPNPICNAATLTLNGAAAGATTYSWAGPGGTGIATPTNVNASVIGVVAGNAGIYTLSATNVCGTTTAATTAVTVTPTVPTGLSASATPNPICNGGTITLNGAATGAVTYSWAGPGGTAITSPTAISATVNGVAAGNAGVYTLSATNVCGTSTAVTSALTVTPTAPTGVTASASPNPICNAATLTLNGAATGASTYSWAGPGGTSITSPTTVNASVIGVIAGNAGIYTLSATNVCGTTTAATSVVTVTATSPTGVTASATPNPICNAATLTLNGAATGAATYSWSGPGGTAISTPTNLSTSVIGVAAGNAGIYTLSATNVCGTTNATTLIVTVTPTAPTGVTASATPNPICNAATLTLNGAATGAASYSWAGPGGTAISTPTNLSTSVIGVIAGNAGVYTLSATNVCGTTTAATTIVTVTPTAPTAVSANATPNPICNAATLTLNGAATGATTYSWAGPGGTGISTPTSANASVVGVAAGNAGIYTLSATNVCGTTTAATSAVTVTPTAPTGLTASATPNPLCNGGTLSLNGGATGAASYSWAGPGGTAITAATTTSASVNGVIAGNAGVYTFSATNVCGTSTAPTLAVTVTPTTPTGVTASATPNPLCNSNTLSLNGAATGATSYSWAGPGGTAINTPTNVNASVVGVIAGNAGVYTLSATNVCGTSSAVTSAVTVNTVPTGVTANATSLLCVTGTLTLTGTASGAASYSWAGPGGTAITSATSPNATVNGVVAGNAGVYTFSATNTCGTTTVTTGAVTIHATPTATPSNNSFICNGGTVTLSSVVTGGTVVNYLWNGAAILTGANASTATAAPTVVGGNTYTLSVNDGTGNSGCASQNTTIVTVNATPSANPTNSGYICNGGTVTIVANAANGASVFTWTGANILSGLGTATVIATPTVTGVYSLTVSDGSGHSGCSPSTQFTTTVTVDPTPGISSVFNTGYICNGGTVSLIAVPSTFLYPTVYAWTGPDLLSTTGPDPMATPTVNSTYTVTVSDGSSQSGCSPSTQYTTTVDVHITPSASPTNNSPICIGGTVSLIANETYNVIDYTWTGSNLSSSTVADPTATPTSSTVYTLVVSDGSGQSGCAPTTQYTTAVTVNGVPSVSVTNNGPVCADVQLTLTASNPANVTGYSWAGPVAITNSTLAVASVPNAQTNATGTYTVTVNNGVGSGCTASFTTQATVNALPTQYNVTGGGPYCAGGLGVPVGLSGSDTGITYYLYNGSSPFGSLAGTGSSLSYGDMTIGGTYSVLATNNITGCNNNMLDTAVVIVNLLPNQYAVLSSGTNYCYGHTGIDVSLSNSDLGIRYQLYIGSTPIGASVNGNTDTISFGVQTIAGDYFAIATDTTTGCTNYMTGAAEIIIDSLPTVYNVSSGGAYCAGGAGIDITLSGSQTGVTYKLMNSTLGIVPMSGTGSLLNYGNQTDTGTYTIIATNNSTACASVMNGNPVIVMNALPAVDTVTGSGTYCQGTSGDSVKLNASTVGINYRLYNGATLVDTVMGTGAAFSFGAQPAGVYTVTAFNATTGCTAGMYGVAAVTMNPAPSVYGITGIANYCANSAGVIISLGGSSTGITYTLFNGATPDSAMAGTGGTLNFGTYTAGNYSIVASNNSTSCTSTMSGGGLVGINAIPVAYAVTGGGPYCAGSGGSVVGVGSSDAGVKYFLYDGSSLVDSMSSVVTGSPVSFGPQAAAGTYTVNAMNVSTGCTNNMSDSVVVTIVTPVTPSLTVTTGMGDTVCLGNTITFTANPVNGGSTPIYQWYLNTVLVADATNIYAHIPANGDVVKAVLISSAACASPDTVSASDTMTVETQATPTVSIAVNPGTLVCAGTPVTFTATSAYGGSLPILSWTVNGVTSSTGNTYTYVPTNGDNVSVELTSNFTCPTVDTAVANVMMTVGAPSIPVVEISANPGTSIATGQVDTLTAVVTNAGSSVSYQWVVNSTVIVGATNSVYYSTFSNNDSVTCQAINYNGCNLEGFNSVKITVFPLDVKAVTFGSGDIRLIPNPNVGTFAIKGTLGTTADEEVTMEVTDILGQVIYKNKVMVHNGLINENVQLSSTLANGMYMMNLRSGSDSKVIHFVIEQ